MSELVASAVFGLAMFVLCFLAGRAVGLDEAVERLKRTEAQKAERTRILTRQQAKLRGDL